MAKLKSGKWRKVNGANVLVGSNGKVYIGKAAIERHNAFFTEDTVGPKPKKSSGVVKGAEESPSKPEAKDAKEHAPKDFGSARPSAQDSYLASTHGRFQDNFLPDEVEAISSLQSDDFEGINSALRSGEPSPTAEIIQGAIAKGPGLKEDFTLYRGMDVDSSVLDQLTPGGDFVHSSFPHASTSQEVARNDFFQGNLELQIRARKGHKALVMTGLGEAEVLYPAGTKFKVVSVREELINGNKVKIAVMDPIV